MDLVPHAPLGEPVSKGAGFSTRRIINLTYNQIMGRYYSGDIEGKFWFAVQASDDASFFGVEPTEPSYLEYYFSETDKESVQKGIAECEEHLGGYRTALDTFFEKNDSYNNEILSKAIGVAEDRIQSLLEWYARLKLGEKIKKCLDEKGDCSFEAEL